MDKKVLLIKVYNKKKLFSFMIYKNKKSFVFFFLFFRFFSFFSLFIFMILDFFFLDIWTCLYFSQTHKHIQISRDLRNVKENARVRERKIDR